MFALSGDLDELKKYVDIDFSDRTDEPSNDSYEFKFFCGRVPKAGDMLNKMDGGEEFDPQYDVVLDKYVFVVGSDEAELSKELLKAEEKAVASPFFPVDWKPEKGKDRYILNWVLYFDNMKDCILYMDFLLNCLRGNGFFKMDMSFAAMEFGCEGEKIKHISVCGNKDLENIKNLHSTIAVLDMDSRLDGIEYLKENAEPMRHKLAEISDSEIHFLQMFYIQGETSLTYFYWK